METIQCYPVYLSPTETAYLYLREAEMEWLRRRIRTGRLDLPGTAVSPYSAAGYQALRESVVQLDMGWLGSDGRVFITPAAAQAIARAKPRYSPIVAMLETDFEREQ